MTDLRHDGGELSFEARIGGGSQRVWLRTDEAEPTSAEAVLPASLMPAMRLGGSLEIPVPISPRVLRTQRTHQGLQASWSREWKLGEEPLREVEVLAPAADPAPPAVTPVKERVAAFFSGGVDSWSTLIDHPEVTDLIFVHGVDLLIDAPHQSELAGEVESRIREVAAELGLKLHVVETNLRQLSDPLIRWDAFYSNALVAVALFLGPRFDRVLIADAADYETQYAMGSSRFADLLWSTEGLEIAQDGGRYSRAERTKRAGSHPVAQRHLRVCWENPGGAYNCGRCQKCLMTMITLEAFGLLDGVETFPVAIDLDPLKNAVVFLPHSLAYWEDILDAVRAAGMTEAEGPLEAVVEGGKRELGLAPNFRRRPWPGPPPLGKAAKARAARRGAMPASPRETYEALARVLDSRSWRLTAPIRRAGGWLRARRRR